MRVACEWACRRFSHHAAICPRKVMRSNSQNPRDGGDGAGAAAAVALESGLEDERSGETRTASSPSPWLRRFRNAFPADDMPDFHLASRGDCTSPSAPTDFRFFFFPPWDVGGIALPAHHHHPMKLCHNTTTHTRLGIQPGGSKAIVTMLRAVLQSERNKVPAPNMAVPPSVRHASLRLMKKPQMQRAIVNNRANALLQMLRIDSPMPWTSSLLLRAIKDEADEASTSGPVVRHLI